MSSQDTLGLGDYVAALKRRWRLGVSVLTLIILGSLVLALSLPDVYRSTARFRLVTDRISELGAEQAEYADQYVFSLAEKVLGGANLRAILRDLGPLPGLEGDEDEALSRLRDGVDVTMTTQTVLSGGGRESTINTGFAVSYSSGFPEAAKKVADALAESFVEMGRVDQQKAAAERRAFFAGEADRINKEIADFERHLADFKSANFNQLPEAVQASLAVRTRTEQELEAVERELRNVRENRVFVEQQLQQVLTEPAPNNLRQLEEEYARKAAVYADTHPDLVALRRQIESLRRGGSLPVDNSFQARLESERAVLAEARQRYSDDHPDIRLILRNIESLEARIAAGEESVTGSAVQTAASVQLQTQLHAFDTQIEGLDARRKTLLARLTQLEAQLGASPEVEREYLAITRGLDSARKLYAEMITRRMEAEVDIAAINAGSADRFALSGPPLTPWEPSGPPRVGIVAVAALLGIALALSTIIALELFDLTIRGTRDLRKVMGAAPLATVPEIRVRGLSGPGRLWRFLLRHSRRNGPTTFPTQSAQV